MDNEEKSKKQSSTYARRTPFYPTPQNQARLSKATTCPDGSKKDNVSKNKIINKALDLFFQSGKAAQF